MPINISVIGAVEPTGPGVGAHLRTDHPLNHLLHPDTAPGPYGIALDVTFQGADGTPLQGLGDSVSGIAPAFLHLGFHNGDLAPNGLAVGPLNVDVLTGSGFDFPAIGLGNPLATDLTVVRLGNLLDKQS
jgi:hypothetical protein